MKIRTHSFAGRRYRVEVEERVLGYAEVPGKKGRPERLEIYVDPDLPPKRHLEIAIHEALHALIPGASEDAVLIAGKELGRWLWRLGYRRDDQ